MSASWCTWWSRAAVRPPSMWLACSCSFQLTTAARQASDEVAGVHPRPQPRAACARRAGRTPLREPGARRPRAGRARSRRPPRTAPSPGTAPRPGSSRSSGSAPRSTPSDSSTTTAETAISPAAASAARTRFGIRFQQASRAIADGTSIATSASTGGVVRGRRRRTGCRRSGRPGCRSPTGAGTARPRGAAACHAGSRRPPAASWVGSSGGCTSRLAGGRRAGPGRCQRGTGAGPPPDNVRTHQLRSQPV